MYNNSDSQKQFDKYMAGELRQLADWLESSQAETQEYDAQYYPAMTELRLHIRVFRKVG